MKLIYHLIKVMITLMVSFSLACFFLAGLAHSILWSMIFFTITVIFALIHINVDNSVDN